MTFQVIPAIDVAGGRLARLSPDGPVAIDAYGGDPVAAARACLEAGAAFAARGRHGSRVLGRGAQRRRPAIDRGARRARPGGGGDRRLTERSTAALDAGSERVVLGSGGARRSGRGRPADRALRGAAGGGDRGRRRSDPCARAPEHRPSAPRDAGGGPRLGRRAMPDHRRRARVVPHRSGRARARPRRPSSGCRRSSRAGSPRSTTWSPLRDAGAEAAVVGRAALEGSLDLAAAIASFASRSRRVPGH